MHGKSSGGSYKSAMEGMAYSLEKWMHGKSSGSGSKSAMEGMAYRLEMRMHGKSSDGGYKGTMEGMRTSWRRGCTERGQMEFTRVGWKE